jgi:FixJ family two-component response regulator
MTAPIVYIVDDDEAVRDSLSLLLETAAIDVECHPNAESFLGAFRPEQSGCVVLDVRMGTMSGPELHMELNRRGCQLAVIYLTAHGDIPMTVRAMKSGAVDFLTKPVDGTLLLKHVQTALSSHSEVLSRHEALAELRERLAELTSREREIMFLAVAGQSNKVIARNLGISHRTVEIHRSHILQKMGVACMLELAHLLAELGLGS